MDTQTHARRPWRGEASYRDYIAHSIQAAPKAWRPCLSVFVDWLEESRGLELSTIAVRVGSIRAFLEVQRGPGGVRTLRTIDETQVEDFFIDHGARHGPAWRRSLQTAMRLFLHFAASRKWVREGLCDAVPRLRSYRLSGVPRGVSDATVRSLVAASSRESARDHAIVLLLAIYGIRRGQVCALRLQDIDWHGRAITFRAHKNGKQLHQWLVPSVAAALCRYLRTERPPADEQAVFLRAKRPYSPLGPSSVSFIVAQLFSQLEPACAPCGPHALRHAFAARLLHKGQPLKVIADLLGHRSLNTVSVYAKIDHPRLLQVAAEWPEVAS